MCISELSISHCYAAIITIHSFLAGLFHLARLMHVVPHVRICFRFKLRMTTTPSYVYTTLCEFICPLMKMWVVSHLLATVTHVTTSTGVHAPAQVPRSFTLVSTQNGVGGSGVNSVSNFLRRLL